MRASDGPRGGGTGSARWNRLAFALSLLAVLAAAVAVQSWAELANRRFDLTPGRRLSLSPWTLGVLAGVEHPLRVELYHRRGERQRALDLLELMRDHCANLSWELVDLDRNPGRAKEHRVDHYDRAVLRYDGRETVVGAESEESLAGAIARVVRSEPRVVYFLSGHRERAIVHGTDEAYGRAAALLRAEGFDLRPLSLLEAAAVPDDAAAVVVAGPEVDLVESEIARLDGWLADGGAVLVLVDPVPLPGLESWLLRRGIRLRDDVVIDTANRAYGTDGTAIVVPFWRDHELTRGLDAAAVLPRARSVSLAAGGDADEAAGTTVLARSTPGSFAAAGAARTRAGNVSFDEARDAPGPVGVMAVARVGADAARAGRLVVVGDADFPSDAFLPVLANKDLFAAAVGWLAADRAGAARPTEEANRLGPVSPVFLSDRHLRAILVGTAIAEPLLFLLAGAVVVARRRRAA